MIITWFDSSIAAMQFGVKSHWRRTGDGGINSGSPLL